MTHQIDTLSEQQLAERQKGIGGSDVAAILGMNPWKSPLDVYLEKRGEAASQPANERMYWGQRLESLVADEYARRHDREIRRKNQTLTHRKYPWMRANVDRIVLRLDRTLECKTTGERNADKWGEPGTDAIPELYMAQVQHYLIVREQKVLDVAVLIGGQEYRDYTVEADPDIRDMLLDEENRFWHEHVLAGIPPAPRTLDETAKLWPRHTDTSVIASNDAAASAQRLRELQEQRKQIEETEKELKVELQAAMGEAAVLLDPDGQRQLATWKYQEQRRLDGKALRADHPDLAEQYEQINSFRKFLLK